MNTAINERRTKAQIEAGEERPEALAVEPDGIPVELKSRKQWVAWHVVRRDGKWTKKPIDPGSNGTPRGAKSNDPTTWGTFDAAIQVCERLRLDGVGIMLGEGLAGVDLDDCRDPETGLVEPWAAALVALLDSYTEVSPSGTGLKTFVLGAKPGNEWSKEPYATGKIEIYDHLRFFAVTGVSFKSVTCEVNERSEALASLYQKVLAQKKMRQGGKAKRRATKGQPPTGGSSQVMIGTGGLTDEDVIRKASAATNGDKFYRLWGGDTSDYDGDDSRADAALCACWSSGARATTRRLIACSAGRG